MGRKSRIKSERRGLDPLMKHIIQVYADAGLDELAQRTRSRQCGTCTFCCTIKSVNRNDGTVLTPANKPCLLLKQGGAGCNVYASRPALCRAYHCLWRVGAGDNDARPDQCGALIDIVDEHPLPLAKHVAQPAMLTVRFDGPYHPDPIAIALNDIAKPGLASHVAFIDSISDEGDNCVYMSAPKAITKALAHSSRTGLAPWNRYPQQWTELLEKAHEDS